jgi:putative methionine-R-sulfoxide reductase with GAF domain
LFAEAAWTDSMHELPQSERFASSGPQDTDAESRRISSGGVADASPRNRALNEPELESALQLLVERAQYITGATGTALALPQGDEMVCRASAGSSAPAVGARLQVLSGLTGESISRRQLLRCDNAETDPRVNLEACRTLGIASIVVLPLFRQNGEVRGVIELFSDHPYAFEERDLVALERMADLTLTALDLAEQRDSAPQLTAPRRRGIETPVELPNARSVRESFAVPRVEEFAHSSRGDAPKAKVRYLRISSFRRENALPRL